jgi:hypothetical protein
MTRSARVELRAGGERSWRIIIMRSKGEYLAVEGLDRERAEAVSE